MQLRTRINGGSLLATSSPTLKNAYNSGISGTANRNRVLRIPKRKKCKRKYSVSSLKAAVKKTKKSSVTLKKKKSSTTSKKKSSVTTLKTKKVSYVSKKPTLISHLSVQQKPEEPEDPVALLPTAKKSAPPPIHLCLDCCCNGDSGGGEKPIDPEIPTPSNEMLEKWKAFVRTAQHHPNILVHPDVRCVRELFGVLGAEIPFENYNLMIELEDSKKNIVEYQTEDQESETFHTLEILQPPITTTLKNNSEEEMSSIFLADTNEAEIIPNLNVVIVREYSIVEECKVALAELVEMVLNYPESILYLAYNFLYEFFLQFGVQPEVITKEIYDTQIRRLQNKIPASSLLIKQGEPEVEIRFSDSSSQSEATATAVELQSLKDRRESRVSCGYSGTDSGFSSIDQNESSEDELEDDLESSQEEDDEEESDDESLDMNGVVYDDGIPQGRGKRRLRKPDSVMRTPYKCTVCVNKYAFKNNCNRHILKCHPGAPLLPVRKTISSDPEHIPPYFCSLCKKAFSSKDSCKNHIRKFHSRNKRAHPEKNPEFIEVKSTPIKKSQLNVSKTNKKSPKHGKFKQEASQGSQYSKLISSDSENHYQNKDDYQFYNSPVVISSVESLLEYMPRVEGLNSCYVLLEKEF